MSIKILYLRYNTLNKVIRIHLFKYSFKFAKLGSSIWIDLFRYTNLNTPV